jgi:hypothetical protein
VQDPPELVCLNLKDRTVGREPSLKGVETVALMDAFGNGIPDKGELSQPTVSLKVQTLLAN